MRSSRVQRVTIQARNLIVVIAPITNAIGSPALTTWNRTDAIMVASRIAMPAAKATSHEITRTV